MLGIQVFNKPNDRKFWMDECVEFNYRWLTEELGIDKNEITFIEDVWAGGGNLGPSIEYFVGGLELGNMVFMQYKTYPDGSREPLQVQVIDVGIGLERIPWLINGSPTSYVDVFPTAFKYLQGKTQVPVSTDVWEKFGSLSCLLNVDEVEDLNKIWDYIGGQIGMEGSAVKKAIEPVRDLYKILDHTRSVLMAVYDGSLPSNVGGAANVRNILRNVFSLLKKRGWWELLGMEGLLQIFDHHRTDLATLYGPFEPYKSFNPIIELEYKRWQTTDDEQKAILQKILKKRKANEKLSIDQWIICVTAHGIPAETVAALAGEEIPGNLWYAIAEQQEREVRVAPTVLYQTAHLAETKNLYLDAHRSYQFDAKILEVIPNVQDKNSPSIIVLDRSAFYPTSGGQDHDTGKMWINNTEYEVVDVLKVGPAVLHIIKPPLPNSELNSYKGLAIKGEVSEERRDQLRNHHTATHIVYASCRRILGPHVWQNGAKKSTHQAHLDITHYSSLSDQQILDIQDEANKIVQSSKPIRKGHMPKDEAEKKYGFHLYQGGIVPGNELRVVSIEDTDTEACCGKIFILNATYHLLFLQLVAHKLLFCIILYITGTHADNTSEVGFIKIIKASRISDGIVRLYYVAGKLALSRLREEAEILNKLQDVYSVQSDTLIATAERFFKESNHYEKLAGSLTQQNIALLVDNTILNPKHKLRVIKSEEATATLYIANMPNYAEEFKSSGKGIVFVGETWIFGLLGEQKSYDPKELESFLPQQLAAEEKRKEEQADKEKKLGIKPKSAAVAPAEEKKDNMNKKAASNKVVIKLQDTVSFNRVVEKKKTSVKVTGVTQFTLFSILGISSSLVIEYFKSKGFTE
jgi:alanyl-tRNA synthetase